MLKHQISKIGERIKKLETRPENLIPRFEVTFADGHTETAWGAALLSYGEQQGVIRVRFDPNDQAAVDTITLYHLLNEVEIIEKTN